MLYTRLIKRIPAAVVGGFVAAVINENQAGFAAPSARDPPKRREFALAPDRDNPEFFGGDSYLTGTSFVVGLGQFWLAKNVLGDVFVPLAA